MEPIRSTYESDPDMLEIVREFAGELPDRALALESALVGDELEDLCRLAHQLKGAGGGYGFPQITDRAALLEAACKEGAPASQLKQLCGALCETLRAVVVPEEE